MSDSRSASATAATRVGSGAGRLMRAWRALPHERQLAAYAAIGLFLSLFLPWYQRQFFVVIGGKIQPASDSQTAWGAFSFVEAAILLVAAGVLVLLFQRAEGKAFHLPGGDGGVITAAGVWSAVLIIWRIFDKQGGAAQGQNATSYGIEWGIFVALAIAVGLILAGSRIRAAHRPEPPLPGDNVAPPIPGGPVSPAPRQMPVLEARIVPPEADEAATVRRASAAPPTPVPAVPHAPAGRETGRDPVEFVPAEPSEFAPRRRPIEASPGEASPGEASPGDASLGEATPAGRAPAERASVERAPSKHASVERAPVKRAPGERQRGWLTARPSHLDEQPPPVPADDPAATLPKAHRAQPGDDTAATLPTSRRRQPPADDGRTIPLDRTQD